MLHLDVKVILYLQVVIVIGLPLLLWRGAGVGHVFPLPIIQIFAGVLLGPSVFGALAPETFQTLFVREVARGVSALAGVETLANVATVLFIFLAGCEADRGIIRKSAGTVLRIGSIGVFLPWILGGVAALMIVTAYPTPEVLGAQQRPYLYAVAFGLCMAVSALPVLVVVLRELGLNQKPIGTIALAIAGLDDALLWTSLAVILPFAAVSTGQAIWIGPAVAVAGAILTIVLMHYVVTPLLNRFIERDAPERVLMSLVILTLFTAAAFNESTQLHAAIGAFLVGLLLPDKLRHMAQDRLDSPTTLLLLPFLFLATGLKTNFAFGDPKVWLIFTVAMIACVGGKFVGVTLPAVQQKLGWPFAMTLGSLMQCKGLMEIVIVTVLYQRQVIGDATFSALILAALTSTAITIPMVRLCMRVFGDAATEPAQVDAATAQVATTTVQAAPAVVQAQAGPAGPRPTLVFDNEIGSFRLPKSEVVIGRHSNDDLRVNDVRVSRHHARLHATADGVYQLDNLTAVRSEPNPILVNGVEKERAKLQDGDVVSLGGVTFTFRQGEPASQAA